MSSQASLRAVCLRLSAGMIAVAFCCPPSVLCGAEPLFVAPQVQPFDANGIPDAVGGDAPYFLPAETPLPLNAPQVVPQPGVRYWIVSSRQSPQEIPRVHCGHLCVYERRCDGSLCPSGLAALTSQLQPGAPVLLFMHGSYVSWEDNLIQSDATWHWIRRACPDRPLNVIFFTWPSDRTRCLLAPCELKRQGFEAETNAFYVASLLGYLPDCHPYCLVGHSYGARMTMATLHLAGGGDLQGMRFGGSVGRKRLRAVLAAGALDHNWLNDGGRYERALCRAECVLNLRNRHDLVLKGYPLLRPLLSRRAIGASGVTFFDRRQQTCTCRIENFDVTGIIDAGHFWPHYYESPQLAQMIAPWVYFPEVNPGYQQTPIPSSPPMMLPTADVDAGTPQQLREVSLVTAGTSARNRPTSQSMKPAGQASAVTIETQQTAMSRGTVSVPTPTAARQVSPSPTDGPRLLQWWRNRGQ
ncbi:MAG: hypothetical protein KDA75_17115 [Planctomycetaceae bacterium]|nr:hypothetical protein [Planctomycetaceae bacterium]